MTRAEDLARARANLARLPREEAERRVAGYLLSALKYTLAYAFSLETTAGVAHDRNTSLDRARNAIALAEDVGIRPRVPR